MKLIVGLGNPGPSYLKNRHNVGFMVLDAFQSFYNLPPFKSKTKAFITEGIIQGIKCLLLKPMGYMNLSGPIVFQAASFYKIPPENIIVVHDDLDLPLGTIRVKIGGGSGGHNGLRSLDAHGSPNYYRLRLGIGHPGHKDLVASYVLQDFRPQELEMLSHEVLPALAKDFPLLLSDQLEDFKHSLSTLSKQSSSH